MKSLTSVLALLACVGACLLCVAAANDDATITDNHSRFRSIPLAHTAVKSAGPRAIDALFQRPLGISSLLSSPLHSDKTTENEPMGGNIFPNGIYWMQVSIGTPPQSFAIAVDTGSTDMLVPGKGCTGCHPKKTGQFDIAASSTINKCYQGACRFSNSYQTCNLTDPTQVCTVSGPVFTDVFAIGDLQAKSPFGVIMYQTPNFQQFFYIDGVIGFSFPGASSWGGVAPYEQFVQAGLIDNVVSMCLNANEGGVITLGGADPSLYHGSIQWTPLINTDFPAYTINMTDIQLNGVSIGLPPIYYTYNAGQGCIVDSGTNIFLLPSKPFAAVQATLQKLFKCSTSSEQAPAGVCGNKNNLFTGNCFKYSEQDLAQFPNMTLHFNDVVLEMAPKDYILANATGYSCLGISDTGASIQSSLLIVGDTLMQNYYSIFDKGQMRLGWAAANLDKCKGQV
ncbi:Aspartic peptidase domain-containing protein [Balamuthia mandrillaris]